MLNLMPPPNRALEGRVAYREPETNALPEPGMVQCKSLLCGNWVRPEEAYPGTYNSGPYCSLECCQNN